MKRALAGLLCLALAPACVSHRVELEPIEVKPIHLTVDINLKVQRELDEFFDFAEEEPAPATEKKEDR
jgi:hypothetical protein